MSIDGGETRELLGELLLELVVHGRSRLRGTHGARMDGAHPRQSSVTKGAGRRYGVCAMAGPGRAMARGWKRWASRGGRRWRLVPKLGRRRAAGLAVHGPGWSLQGRPAAGRGAVHR